MPFGKKKILEARGLYGKEDLLNFKSFSKGYFYGTIAPCVISYTDEDFVNLGYKKVSNSTILIDLSKGEEELWRSVDKGSIRWGVNYAKKNGLVFQQAKEAEIEVFYDLYDKTASEGGFKAESQEFILSIVKSDKAKLFLIKNKDKILAGGLILIDQNNNYSILDLTSVSEEGMSFQAMPFLYWNLIIYSKSQGLKYFDLGGYDREAREGEKTRNINPVGTKA